MRVHAGADYVDTLKPRNSQDGENRHREVGIPLRQNVGFQPIVRRRYANNGYTQGTRNI